MATKKFAQMTTKKLNALLETANDEDRAQIEAILAAREQVATPAVPEATTEKAPAPAEASSELTPEEEAAIATAETPEATTEEVPAAFLAKKQKMTDEERHALAEELKKNVNHRCQAVPFNTVEWVDGYIAGVIEEKRTNRILYAIKTDDGLRIVKVHGSNLIRILDEVIEPEHKPRARRAKENVEHVEWTPEIIADEINAVIGNVGRQVKFEKYRTTDEDGNEKIEMVTGRIVAIVPDKRNQRLFYRISVPTPVEGNPLAVKTMHKVVATEGLTIAPELDEEGAEFNAKYRERRKAAAIRTPLAPQDRVIRCEENLKKAEEKLAKAQEELEAKKKQLEEAKAELDAYLAAQMNGGVPAETEVPEVVETAEDNEPLD